jgi:hypothetical protein
MSPPSTRGRVARMAESSQDRRGRFVSQLKGAPTGRPHHERLPVGVEGLEAAWNLLHGPWRRKGRPRSSLELPSIAITFYFRRGHGGFVMPTTSRETSRKDTGDAVTIGLVLAAVVATFFLFGPVLLSDQKSVDVVATQQPTDSPIKTP